MKLFTTIAQMREERESIDGHIGLVPTMGYLHAGHIALTRQAKKENAVVVVSIFVNPKQFSPEEDLETYPRDIDHDIKLLEDESVDIIFAPTVEEVYPMGHCTYVDVDQIASRLEGSQRPKHFRGVATVVTKLFSIINPTRSYFGQKDGQQLLVIKRLAQDLNLATEIRSVPTVREADGLALSSRNSYLSNQERQAAPVIFRSLCHVDQLWHSGERDGNVLRQEIRRVIETEPLAKIDYISIADMVNLEELSIVNKPAMASIAVRFGKARLIDNILLEDAV